MNENNLRLLIQQIIGTGAVGNVSDQEMQMFANPQAGLNGQGAVGNVSDREMRMFQGDQRNSYMDEVMNMRSNNPTNGAVGNMSQSELLRLITSPEQISSGDPDGMTAPPMQLTDEEMRQRQMLFDQQNMQPSNGEQMQLRDDAIFDRILKQRMQQLQMNKGQ